LLAGSQARSVLTVRSLRSLMPPCSQAHSPRSVLMVRSLRSLMLSTTCAAAAALSATMAILAHGWCDVREV
jgi:hypothetical protein